MASFCDIKAILNKHGLPYGEITKCGTGFRNEVWIAGDHVVKMYGAHSLGYGKELWFYQNAKPPYSPRLIEYGENYIILERIYGGAEQYFRAASNWQQYVLARIQNNVEELTNTKGIPPALAKQALLYTLDHICCLDDKKLFLTYTDLHFDNIIITECGRLYLLDYEMLEAAPCDFVLDVWQRMLIHPFIYANEDDHALTVPEDYRHIMSWLKKYAPSLFSHPHVHERVNIYGILYELNMLRDFPMGGWPIERIEKLLNGVEW